MLLFHLHRTRLSARSRLPKGKHGPAHSVRATACDQNESNVPVPAAHSSGDDLVVETLTMLETNLDDSTPQCIAYVLERALTLGALDAWSSPITMKKGRPGLTLSVLCRPENVLSLQTLLFKETTTLGVRCTVCERVSLPRKFVTVVTKWGSIPVKVATLHGVIVNAHPEYEDCARVARECNVPLKAVFDEAKQAFAEQIASTISYNASC
eukprot:jgi/Chlat1/1425/Chrsp12S01984